MRRLALSSFLAFVAFLFCGSGLYAQVDPNLEQVKPFGAYSTDFDIISMVNGGLSIHIPLFSYPQRGGKLRLNLELVYQSSGWTQSPLPYPYPGYFMTGGPGGRFGVGQDQWLGGDSRCLTTYNGYTYGWPLLADSEGTIHPVGQTSKAGSTYNFRSIDGTGLQLLNFTYQNGGANSVAVDRDGVRYSFSSDGLTSIKTDPNGNVITLNASSVWTDTLGRSIPLAPDPYNVLQSKVSTDTTGCQGQFAASAAYLWLLPGPSGGTTQMKLCFTNISIETNFLHNLSQEHDRTPSYNLMETLIVYNGVSWASSPAWIFEYNDRDSGDPSTVNYASLTKITFPTGGTVSYTYQNQPSPWAPSWRRAVTQKTVNANDGAGPHSWTYSYNLNAPARTITSTVTDPLGNDTVYMLIGLNGSTSFYPTEVDTYSGSHSSGTLAKTVKTSYQFTPGPSESTVGVAPCVAGVYSVVPISSTTIWPNGQQSVVQTTYDSGFSNVDGSGTAQTGLYGSPMARYEYDYGSGGPGSLLRTTSTNYLAFSNSTYLADNLLSLPSSVQVSDGGGTVRAYTTYGYDETTPTSSGITTQHGSSPHGSVRGNLTSVHRQLLNGSATATPSCPVSVGNGGYLVTANTYFDTGALNVSKDPCTHPTTYAYSASYAGAYPTSVTNALNQTTIHTYDFNTGLLSSTKDPNNQTTSFTYDPFWRIASISYPDSGLTTITHQEAGFPFTATESRKMDGSHSLTSVRVFDGLGRVTQAQLTSDPQGTDYTNTSYDALGRVNCQSNPFRVGNESTSGQTCYGYDPLNRVTNVSEADGSAKSMQYCGSSTLAIDEAGRWRRSTADGLGRLIEVDEPNSLSASVGACPSGGDPIVATNYAYDTPNNLTQAITAGSRQRNFTYDSLSRLTLASNPESGTATYAYDADSNVITKTSPKPNQSSPSVTVTATYAYEPLNRITSKSYNDGMTPTATFLYDVGSADGLNFLNPVGRLVKASNGGTAITYNSYDPIGRVKDQWQCTPYNCGSGTWHLIYGYDLIGDVTSLSNGGGTTLAQVFNGAARLQTITSSLSDSQHPATLASVADYWPGGQLHEVSYGNGLTGTWVYNSRLQPCRVNLNSSASELFQCSDAVPSQNRLDFGYGFNAGTADNGNVASWSAAGAQTFTRSYIYDQVSRVKSMSGTGGTCTGLSWIYDVWGNRTDQTATSGSCGELHVMFNSQNQISNLGYQYDAAGNVIGQPGQGGSQTYQYDAENRLSSVNGGAQVGGANYVYDASGQRVQRVVAGVQTNYVYDIAGHVAAELNGQGSWTTGYAYLNGSLVAQYTPTATYFAHADHLGSTRLVTAMAQNVQECDGYYPYGELDTSVCTPATSTTTVTHKFTGKERDNESGLDNFIARYNSSSLGRFMSPDPGNDSGFENQDDPQGWNAYSYVRNNPLKLTDPEGRDYSVCVDKDGASCVTYANMRDFQEALKGTGATLVGDKNNGEIIVNINGQNVVAGTYQFFVGPGVEGGGLQPDILGNIAIGVFAGGVVNAGRGFIEGLVGTGAREAAAGASTGATTGGAAGSLAPGTVFNAGKGLLQGEAELSSHAAAQAALKGVTKEEIAEALSHVPKQEATRGSVLRFIGRAAEVRVNRVTGTIVTVIRFVGSGAPSPLP